MVPRLLAARRASLESFAPVYWRAAPDARERHTRFLRAQVTGRMPGARTLRTDHAVLFATPRPDGHLALDDVALEDTGTWAADGTD